MPEAVIVNISSLAGLVGLYGYSPYAMSKFAIRDLTEALQSEFSGSNISLLIVHPGGVKTNIIKNAPDLRDAQQRESAHVEFSRFAMFKPESAARKYYLESGKIKGSWYSEWIRELSSSSAAFSPDGSLHSCKQFSAAHPSDDPVNGLP